MRRTRWFSESFRRDVHETVTAVERETCADVVVAVRPFSARYRQTDLAVGLVAALARQLHRAHERSDAKLL